MSSRNAVSGTQVDGWDPLSGGPLGPSDGKKVKSPTHLRSPSSIRSPSSTSSYYKSQAKPSSAQFSFDAIQPRSPLRGANTALNNELSRFFDGKVPPYRGSTFDPATVVFSMAGLRLLAAHDCWPEVIRTSQGLLKANATQNIGLNTLDVHAYLMTAFVKLEQYDEASKLLAQLISEHGDLKEHIDTLPLNLLLMIGHLYFKHGDPKGALDFLLNIAERLAGRNRLEDRKRCLLHVAAYSLEQRKGALAAHALKRLILDNPSDYGLWSLLGRTYLQMGDLQSADACFRKSGDFEADHHAQVTTNSTFMLVAKGQLQPAMATFAGAAAKSEQIATCNNFSVCALYNNQVPEAISTLEGIIAKNPSKFVTEPLMSTLWRLYCIGGGRGLPLKKQLLESLVALYTSEDFKPRKFNLPKS